MCLAVAGRALTQHVTGDRVSLAVLDQRVVADGEKGRTRRGAMAINGPGTIAVGYGAGDLGKDSYKWTNEDGMRTTPSMGE